MNKNTLHHISKTEQDTISLAHDLAEKIQKNSKKTVIICLYGTLGAGKSVFSRAFIQKTLKKPDLNVPSPTFTLVQIYESSFRPIYHYDLYRLEDPEEIYELGWEDSLAEGITLVEWPEKLAGIKPAETLDIRIKHADNGDDRIITITGA